MKNQITFSLMSVKAWGGGLKALTDMSAKNVSFFVRPKRYLLKKKETLFRRHGIILITTL